MQYPLKPKLLQHSYFIQYTCSENCKSEPYFVEICDPTPANEALCGKIKFWVMSKNVKVGQNFSKIKVCLEINFDIYSMSS